MTHRRHARTMSRLIASELVGHQPPGFTFLALPQTAEAPCSRTLMATTLHENVYSIPILINRRPEILPLPLTGHEHVIDVSHVPQTSLGSLEVAGIVRHKFPTPFSNGFIGHGDVSFGEKFFHLPEAETEPMIQPDSVTDNFRGKAMTVIAGCWGFHHASLPNSGELDHVEG